MNDMKSEEIKEEFYKASVMDTDLCSPTHTTAKIADWWIKKFESEILLERERLLGIVKDAEIRFYMALDEEICDSLDLGNAKDKIGVELAMVTENIKGDKKEA